MLLAHITTDREAVSNPRVKIDLIRLFRLNKDRFGFMALLGGEDLVGFSGCDGERTGDCCEFGFFDEARIYQYGFDIIEYKENTYEG